MLMPPLGQATAEGALYSPLACLLSAVFEVLHGAAKTKCKKRLQVPAG